MLYFSSKNSFCSKFFFLGGGPAATTLNQSFLSESFDIYWKDFLSYTMTTKLVTSSENSTIGWNLEENLAMPKSITYYPAQ
jgi:hypothetical protein